MPQIFDRETLGIASEFATQIGRSWQGSYDLLDLVDQQFWRIEQQLYSVGVASRNAFHSVPELIQQDVGYLPLFEIAEFSQVVVHLYSGHSDRSVPHDVRYVFSGLATRAIATLREIAILLDNGYAFGARSRWRTLSEILVVARVLATGDRDTASRYKEHRWVMIAAERNKLEHRTWESDLPDPEVVVRELARKFGEPYLKGQYGWAAEVAARDLEFTGYLKWHHLEKIAATTDLESRVQVAHHAVHADALGLLGAIVDGSGHFHSGASPKDVLEVARDTVHLFRDAMWALFANCVKYSDKRKTQVLQAMIEVHVLNGLIALNHSVMKNSSLLQ